MTSAAKQSPVVRMRAAGFSGRHAGFTLMELMIVIIIVAILAAVAIPGYQDQVRKTRRSAATKDLMLIAQALERFYTLNGTYANGPCVGSADTADHYTINCPTRTATAFTVQAAPKGAQASDKCGTLTYTQANVKGVTDAASGVTVADCW